VYRLFRLTDLLELGDLRAMEREIEAFSQLTESLELPQSRWYTTLFASMRSHLKGDLAATERLVHEVLAQGQAVSDRNSALSFTVLLGQVMLERGRFGDMAPAIDQVRRNFPALDDAWRSALAYGFAESRLANDSSVALENVDARGVPRNVLWLAALTSLSIASACLGDRGRAEVLYELLEPYADRMAVVGYSVMCLGSVARPLGMLAATLGQWELAERHFRNALTANERIGSPLWVGHTLHYYARMLASRGRKTDTRRARELASRGLEIAAPLGLCNLETNLRLLLEQLEAGGPVSFSLFG